MEVLFQLLVMDMDKKRKKFIVTLFRLFTAVLTLLSIVVSSAKDYQIPRNRITLETIIGQGQFGDVHRGAFTANVSTLLHTPALSAAL